MTITLPDDLRAGAEERAKALGFGTVEDYVLDLVRNDEAADAPILRPENRAALERLLDEGAASGEPIVVDDAFWERRRQVLAERLTRRNGSPS